MQSQIIRIQSIELRHFKNVKYGRIEMPSAFHNSIYEDKSEILGIYGQNGSGKTAVIESLDFLKCLLSGESLNDDTADYIMKGFEEAEFSYKFYIQKDENQMLADYIFTLKAGENKKAIVSKEKITVSKLEEGQWKSKVTLCEYSSSYEDILIRPKYKWETIVNAKKSNRIELEVAKKMSVKESKSFLFSNEVIELLIDVFGDTSDVAFAISNLYYYGKTNLFVIKNNYSGAISLDVALPLSFKQEDENCLLMGNLAVSLSEPTVMNKKRYEILTSIIDIQNLVIKSLIPEMELLIKEYGFQFTKDGEEGVRFEILSKRGETTIPLRYESEGIMKILSILSLLISMYNNPSMCIAIDELDAGIYEYLLGELLVIIEEGGKGQLIFTSHNLRPLEMIHKEFLIFTTTNPDNRYIRLTNIKKTNNLRDIYLRSIHLGGQKETVYENTNGYEISRAFRKAGRKVNGQN